MSTQGLQKEQINRTDLFLILLVTVFWGLSYPIMKFVVKTYPPLTFRSISFVIGVLSIAAVMIKEGHSFKVPRSERGKIFKLSLGSMVGWHLGLIFGVLLLNSGRAAIIGYTMPVWALLSSVLFYGAKFTWKSTLGVVLALSATILLAVHESSTLLGAPIGLMVMLAAAIAWGIGTTMMKNTPVSISNMTLTFWTLVIAMLVFVALAILIEHDRWTMPNFAQWLAILYGGVVTFAFCYVAWFRVARKLPPVVSGLSVMLVPVVGVFSSSLMLGEPITMFDLSALLLILLAMVAVLVPSTGKVQKN